MNFNRRFFYIPIQHFSEHGIRYFYPPYATVNKALCSLTYVPWGTALDAVVIAGTAEPLNRIEILDSRWTIFSEHELHDMGYPNPAILNQIAPNKHLVAVGSLFFLNGLHILRGYEDMSNQLLYAIGAATGDNVIYEMLAGSNSEIPFDLMDMRDDHLIEPCMPEEKAVRFDKTPQTYQTPRSSDFFCGGDGAMG